MSPLVPIITLTLYRTIIYHLAQRTPGRAWFETAYIAGFPILEGSRRILVLEKVVVVVVGIVVCCGTIIVFKDSAVVFLENLYGHHCCSEFSAVISLDIAASTVDPSRTIGYYAMR